MTRTHKNRNKTYKTSLFNFTHNKRNFLISLFCPGWSFGVLWDRSDQSEGKGLIFGLIYSGIVVFIFWSVYQFLLAKSERYDSNLVKYTHKDHYDPRNVNGDRKTGFSAASSLYQDLHDDQITEEDFEREIFIIVSIALLIYLIFILRVRINSHKNIKSSCFENFYISACCGPCYLNQAANEYGIEVIQCCSYDIDEFGDEEGLIRSSSSGFGSESDEQDGHLTLHERYTNFEMTESGNGTNEVDQDYLAIRNLNFAPKNIVSNSGPLKNKFLTGPMTTDKMKRGLGKKKKNVAMPSYQTLDGAGDPFVV